MFVQPRHPRTIALQPRNPGPICSENYGTPCFLLGSVEMESHPYQSKSACSGSGWESPGCRRLSLWAPGDPAGALQVAQGVLPQEVEAGPRNRRNGGKEKKRETQRSEKKKEEEKRKKKRRRRGGKKSEKNKKARPGALRCSPFNLACRFVNVLGAPRKWNSGRHEEAPRCSFAPFPKDQGSGQEAGAQKESGCLPNVSGV